MTVKPRPPRKRIPVEEGKVRVFVYGTLRKGCVLNRHWMTGATYVRDATIYSYTMISFGPYPALIQLSGALEFGVEGEVWNMDEEKFDKLRQMEEGVGYTTRDIPLEDGTSAKAFVFTAINKGTVRWRQRLVKVDDKLVAAGDVVPATAPEFDDDIPF